MKCKYLAISLLIFIFDLLNSQSIDKMVIGTNLSNNLVNMGIGKYENGGYAIELNYLYKLTPILDLKFFSGYTKTSSNIRIGNNLYISQKIQDINKGWYLKAGVLSGFSRKSELLHSNLGLLLFYSHFNQRANFSIHGNYFGDYHGHFKQLNQWALFIEPYYENILYETEKFSLSFSLNYPIRLFSGIDSNYPVYFIPGYGNYNKESIDIRYIYYRFEFHLLVPLNVIKKNKQTQ